MRLLRRSALVAVAISAYAAGLANAAAPRFHVTATQRVSDPSGLVAADITKDGRPDLVTGRFFGGGLLQTMPGRGGGRFGRVRRSASSSSFLNLSRLVDLDHDGRLDAIGIEGYIDSIDGNDPEQVWVAYGRRGGRFGKPFTLGPFDPLSDPQMVVLDFNRDGRADIAALEAGSGVFAESGNQVRLYENLGRRRFASRLATGPDGGQILSFTPTETLLTGDLNADQAPDLVLAGDDFSGVPVAVGVGAFALRSPPADLSQPTHLADVNEDGKLDLLFPGSAANARRENPIVVATGDGAGDFNPPAPSGVDRGLESFELIDLDGDSHLDLITPARGGLIFYRGDGEGHFSGGRRLAGTGGNWDALVFADFNHDHRVDLAGQWGRRTCCSRLRVAVAK
jgi:FG-GAP-like repeat